MVRVCTLFSGSSANSSFIEVDGRAVLVDVGASTSRMTAALEAIGSGWDKIDAIFITHEHTDHIAALPILTKKYRIPVIANPRTLNGILNTYPNVNDDLFIPMQTGSRAVRGGFDIISFPSSHDSAECVGYVISTPAGKIGVMTDCGTEKPWMASSLEGCKVLILEANHDMGMLMDGPYPYSLKKRISGEYGHMSNMQSAMLLGKIVDEQTKMVYLAHLSKENNTPATALDTVRKYLAGLGIFDKYDFEIEVAPRYGMSGIVSLS